jgi:hypothetical protein
MEETLNCKYMYELNKKNITENKKYRKFNREKLM